eukprot:g491.t1
MWVRSFCQLVRKSRTLLRRSPRADAFLKNPNDNPAKAIAVVMEALQERHLSSPVLNQLLTGPLHNSKLKAMDMKRLTFLFHSLVDLRSHGCIQSDNHTLSTDTKSLDESIAAMLDEILSLDRFLQFDNRLTISRVLLGLTMLDEVRSEDLKRMNYKIMSRSKRLHPETLVDVLFSWTCLQFHDQEQLHIISAEALVHRCLLSANYLAKAVWAWCQLGKEFEDHVDQFMESVVQKMDDLNLEDSIRILSSAQLMKSQQNRVLLILDHFFRSFNATDLSTSQLMLVLKSLESVHSENNEYWKRLIDQFGSYRHLSRVKNSEFVFLVKICLERGVEDEDFIDRLSFEAAQSEKLNDYSTEELILLCGAMKAFNLLNYFRVFSKEFICRDLALNGVREMVEVWLQIPLEEEYFVELFEKLSDEDKEDLRSLSGERLQNFNYHVALKILFSTREPFNQGNSN